eukprot:gnl/TRDRNA2_/TRDRNA2_178596_c0_seq1.p1 gnl/TRDRNA2_/TRDRNA2_178596_c0~~gnl/TRDRNA2_/TRDRNA2_178596_c0_seq1.p1  ORF type:complete len:409 (-),score=108.53 gnl/TRDRNA2_/TRDRNA2_178596_c0_seq1:264-1490(-)
MKSPSESSNSWLSSNAVAEIEQYFLLVFTSVLGWWLVMRVRRHFDASAGRTRTTRTLNPTKVNLDAETLSPGTESHSFLEELDEDEDEEEAEDNIDDDDDDVNVELMPENQPSAASPPAFFPPPGLSAPPGLEEPRCTSPSASLRPVAAAKASQAAAARCGAPASMSAASANTHLNKATTQPAAPAAKAAAVADADAPKAPKKKKKKAPPIKEEMKEGGDREIGRCVCWRDNGFGFLVDEDGERLFVRGGEVGIDVKLMPGQLVWFRRGKTGSGSSQATKAFDIAVVDVEVAKVLRKAERDGISWSKIRSAVLQGDLEILNGIKGATKASTKPSEKKAVMKPTTSSGDKQAGKQSTTSKEQQVELGSTKDLDADLRAFLGEGSVDQMRANLKYAPQWVTEKFVARHGP